MGRVAGPSNRLADPKGDSEGRLLLRRTSRHARSWKEIGMQRSPSQVGLTAVTVLTMAIAMTIVTGPVAVAEPPLSCAEDIPAYLVGIGVNPDDAARAVCQEGPRNYAGPSCPGTGWNCVRANVPIVQIGGINVFYCTALNCLVIQAVHGGSGQNASACERRVDNPTTEETVMVCDIMQVNGGPGTNAATISQHIQQTKGTMQKAREIARITQENETKSNIARIIQVIGQAENAKGGSPITQKQEAHQAATVIQTTKSLDIDAMLGDNTSNIDQRQNQSQRASVGGTGSTITQGQNTTSTGDLINCDQPGDVSYDQVKNQCADVTQHSGVISVPGGGDNSSTLNHDSTQRQTAEKAETVNQSQGASTNGEEGIKDQLSSGVSTGTATQDMLQVQTAPPSASGLRSQETGDPRCCWLQFGNTANSADIFQTTLQTASPEDADQNASLVGRCNSDGTCHVEQSATTDYGSHTESCTGSCGFVFTECSAALASCTGGVD
jgi:hypothetical protein